MGDQENGSLASDLTANQERVVVKAKSQHVQIVLEAAANGDLETLKNHVSQHVQEKDYLQTLVCTSGCTVLHWAAGYNQLAIVQYLTMPENDDGIPRMPVDLPVRRKYKAQGRTPLHYACRNGAFETAQWLVHQGRHDPEAKAKHGVTPFQLAIWQNRLKVCQWLVEEVGVDPKQTNEFDCGAIHWMGICPLHRAINASSKQETTDSDTQSSLLAMVKWLATHLDQKEFHATQRQGHTALHKAAWGGHLELIQWLHDNMDLWDDRPDDAGNYAADLADMANASRHANVADYLRCHCSRARAQSCAILGVALKASPADIRSAYLRQAKSAHPDREVVASVATEKTSPEEKNHKFEFDEIHKAYRHLVDEGGRGKQSNPAHSLHLMLEASGLLKDDKLMSAADPDENTTSFFKARLLAVLLEYGSKGLNLSNVKKKWGQVWPEEPFPDYPNQGKKRALSDFITEVAGDVVVLQKDNISGILRAIPKNCSQAMVAEIAVSRNEN